MEQGESPYERVTVMPGKPDKSDISDCIKVPAHTGKLSFLNERRSARQTVVRIFFVGNLISAFGTPCPLMI